MFLWIIVLIGILAPIISNDKPIIAFTENGIEFPFTTDLSYTSNPNNLEIWPLIPYHSTSIDFNNMNAVGPFDIQNIEISYYKHRLGTDELGRDVLAGIIHGSQTALFIGFGSMAISLILGLVLGGIAGYFQNNKLH